MSYTIYNTNFLYETARGFEIQFGVLHFEVLCFLFLTHNLTRDFSQPSAQPILFTSISGNLA